MIGLTLGYFLTAEFIQNKQQYKTNDDDFNCHNDLGWSRAKLIPRFGSGINSTAALSVTEAKNIKILSAALITRGRDNTLLTTADVFLTGFTSEKLESLIINFVEVAVLALATSGTIGTGEAAGKGVVAKKVDYIRDGCQGGLG